MEALLELEKVQRVLSYMSSRGLSDSGGGGVAADRFLAQFILFLATPDTMEEVKHFTSMEADQDLSSRALLQPNKKCKMHAEKLTIQAAPMCRSYFMFHGLDANNPQSLFKYLPVLSFTESYIYQLDASNEDCLHLVPDNSISSKKPGGSNILCVEIQ